VAFLKENKDNILRMLKVFNNMLVLSFSLFIMFNNYLYSNWSKVSEVNGSSCILTFNDIILVGSNNGIYRSVDNGLSWSHYPVDSQYSVITDLSKNHDFIFAGTYYGVYSSADTGRTWNSLGPPYSILSVYAIGSTIFACIHGGGLFRSENNGQSWTPINGNSFYSYLLHENKIFGGTFSGIYVSIDNGFTWDLTGLPNKIITSLSKNDNYIFVANYTYGIYRSDDFGGSWLESNYGLNLNLFHPYSVFAKDSLIFIGLTSNKIYLSTDSGQNWNDFSNGISISENTYNVKFSISKNKIFVSFLYNSLWYYDLSQLTIIPEPKNQKYPKLMLPQNYPNPFNPVTTIKYTLHKKAHVRIEIYNSIGQRIESLIDKDQLPDKYSIQWDASINQLPSGVYFYQVTVDDEVHSRRMIYLK
jgi:hypothetical protein